MQRVFAILCATALFGCHSIELAPTRPANDPLLAQASEALEAGDHVRACKLLSDYAAKYPKSKNAPTLCGEVLFKLARFGESRAQFESALARLDDDADLPTLVHCHGRLVELAAIDADEAAERLHRGIGLYLLSKSPSERDDDDDADPESILFKSIHELNAAHAAAPDDARPCWYLHLAWRALGKDGPARRWLHQCDRLARVGPTSTLTPSERRRLDLRLCECVCR